MDPHINPFEVCFPHQNLYLFSHITIYNFYNIINYGTLFCFVFFFFSKRRTTRWQQKTTTVTIASKD